LHINRELQGWWRSEEGRGEEWGYGSLLSSFSYMDGVV
jgi:hypothetical protein